MSKIEKLEKDLYEETKNEDLGKRMEYREFPPGTHQKSPSYWSEKNDESEKVKDAIVSKKTIIKFIGGAVTILLIAVSSLSLFLYLGSGGKEAKIAIFGRSPIESGEIVTIPITLKNISKSAIREAEVSVVFPEASLLIEDGRERPALSRIARKLDDFAPGEEKTFSIQARMFGYEGEEKNVEVVMLYRPENLRARFSVKESFVFVIGRVPLSIAWDIPEFLSSGQEVLVNVRYASSAKTSFDNLSLRLIYSPGFQFVSASPQPAVGNDLWKIGAFDPGEEGVIRVRGFVSGEEGEIKPFRAELGIYDELTKEWKSYSDSIAETSIAVSLLSVQGFYDEVRTGNIAPGTPLLFQVRYKNNTSYTIKNVTVRAFLSELPAVAKERVLEFLSLEIDKKGVFDATTRAVIWGPGNVSELREVEPGGEGSFSFRIRTKERPLMRNMDDTNIQIALRSGIEAAGVPEDLSGTRISAEDNVSFKVSTKALFSGRAVHRISPIPNSGPLPPKVGEKTTYTLVWEVKNFTNMLENAEIKTTLPPNVTWENSFFPKDARISFDPASGEVYWRIGQVKSGVGVLSPTLVGAFQVSVIPSDADRGKAIIVTGESKLSGKDNFTGELIGEKIPSFSTELREDSATTQDDWKVVR